jgi:prolyl-tRNA editing enzyme YbaK/EbsC (Cys-tRNA(Pro) deacylase)
MEPLTPAHVQKVLDATGLGLKVDHFEVTTHTSVDAAAAIGCELGQIAKSMCLMAGGNPVLVVAAGDRRIADAVIARHLGVGRKKVKIATPTECVDIFGYPPGGVSPVGHRTPGIPVIIDESLSRWPEIHAAAGTDHDNFSLTYEQLIAITGGTPLPCTREPAVTAGA